jgi:hypothetical protein
MNYLRLEVGRDRLEVGLGKRGMCDVFQGKRQRRRGGTELGRVTWASVLYCTSRQSFAIDNKVMSSEGHAFLVHATADVSNELKTELAFVAARLQGCFPCSPPKPGLEPSFYLSVSSLSPFFLQYSN